MKCEYHSLVQNDVSRIISYYDEVSDSKKTGNEFFEELMVAIAEAAKNPERFHFEGNDRTHRRVNLSRFSYHFLFKELPAKIRVTVGKHNSRRPVFGKGRV